MNEQPPPRTDRGPLLVPLLIFAAAIALRLAIVCQPIPVQLARTLPDDAYYYFLTAANIVKGLGPSVDGINPSNGWHPLWLVINLPIFALPFQTPDAPVRAVLALGALLDSLACLVLYLTARRFVRWQAAAAGMALYALNAMPLFQAVNGLETGLTALLIAAALAATLGLLSTPSWRNALMWGAVFGLCFLARTDSALILVWLGIWVLIGLPGGVRWRLTTAGALTALAVAAPWFIWNQIHFGSPLLQSSSITVPWAIQARYLMENPGAPLWRLSVQTALYPQVWLRGDYLGAPPLIGFALWPLALWGMGKARRSSARRLGTAALLLAAGGICLFAVHTLIRWYPRPWYFIVSAHSLTLGFALALDALRSPRLRAAVLTAGLTGAVVFGMLMWRVGYSPWQTTQYAAAEWIRENTPPEAIIGSMNSGIMGYYGGRTVINLDGVVNPAAFEAIQDRSLLAYMQREQMGYLIDSDHALSSEYGPFLGGSPDRTLQEIAAIGEPYPGLGSWRVYAVLAEGE